MSQIQLDRWLQKAELNFLLGNDPKSNRPYELMKLEEDPLPKNINIGRSSRWSLRAVTAWMVRRSGIDFHTQENSDETTLDRLITPPASEKLVKLQMSAAVMVIEAREGMAIHPEQVEAMKLRYYEGKNLDALCAEFKIGKTRLSALLHKAGVKMRRPGKKASRSLSVPVEAEHA